MLVLSLAWTSLVSRPFTVAYRADVTPLSM